jgi:para-aminobenzoate synthetase component I
MNRKTFINKLNSFGAKRIPVFFIIDFLMKNPVLIPINKINPAEILYQMPGIRNYTFVPHSKTKLEFNKSAIPFVEYNRAFKSIIQQIKLGNSYLVNLTFPTLIETNYSLQDIFYASRSKYKLWYKNLFTVYSPETFVSIKEGKIYAFPMKGTIDASIPGALKIILADKKETAEHYTIVDLLRNDLSMVAENIKVERFRYISKVKTNGKDLYQVSSKISGHLPQNYNEKIGDIINELLPAGSVTGAPKKKTVEIIRNTEKYERGYYTGVAGYFDGKNLDSFVMIRFLENTSNGLRYKSGGGVTSFSKVKSEYSEMVDKVYVPL